MEKYLRECLDSIKAQTFTDWECILVDDGSTDSSPLICDEYSAEDARFRVIHKSNGGLSAARNAALNISSGEYIAFVDSDDWIEPTMFEILYELITKSNADIAQCGFIKEYKGRHSTKHLTRAQKVISGEEAKIKIGFDLLPNYVWNKLHKKSIITCGFPEGRNFEDIVVYGEWLKNVKSMALDPSPLYHYRMRRGSIIHAEAAKNRYDYFTSCLDRMIMIESSLSSEKDITRKNAFIIKSGITASKIIARFESNKERREETILKIRKDLENYPLPSPFYIGLKNWWRAKLLKSHPNLFSSLMRGVHIFDLDVRNREKRYFD